jgi:hypothetical protein
VAENSLECCHCRVAHRELVDLLDMDQFVRDVSECGVPVGWTGIRPSWPVNTATEPCCPGW